MIASENIELKLYFVIISVGDVLAKFTRSFHSPCMRLISSILAIALCACTAEPEEKKKAVTLFNGKDLSGWKGDGYIVKDGVIACTPQGKNLMTEKVYTNYVFDFEFKLPPGGNNGVGIHYPGEGDPAYTGMEVQVLDDTAEKYQTLKEYQFHGGLYTLQAAKKGHLKPVGEWNRQKITVNGNQVTVELNGTVINEANLDELATKYPKHQGVLRRSGHITFCGHGDPVQFRNISIIELPAED